MYRYEYSRVVKDEVHDIIVRRLCVSNIERPDVIIIYKSMRLI
jgi:hypothetical protein